MGQEYFWWGPMWFMPMMMPVVMLVAVIVCLYLMFGRSGFRPPGEAGTPAGGETALDILKKRYARGEIGKDEFEQMKRDIMA